MPDEITRVPQNEGRPNAGDAGLTASHPFRKYHNARVTVHYNSGQGFRDTGSITYIDADWVELMKDNKEIILVPAIAIRLIVLLETSKAEGDANILLRPADNRPLEKIKDKI